MVSGMSVCAREAATVEDGSALNSCCDWDFAASRLSSSAFGEGRAKSRDHRLPLLDDVPLCPPCSLPRVLPSRTYPLPVPCVGLSSSLVPTFVHRRGPPRYSNRWYIVHGIPVARLLQSRSYPVVSSSTVSSRDPWHRPNRTGGSCPLSFRVHGFLFFRYHLNVTVPRGTVDATGNATRRWTLLARTFVNRTAPW